MSKIDNPVLRTFVPNELRFSTLRITSYSDQNFEGYVELPTEEACRPFRNLTQLLFQLDRLADELGCPLRSRSPRSFGRGVSPVRSGLENAPPEKPIASFRICIMFRQNMSWQGSCEWLEEKQSANFRSALELIQLMDGALTGMKSPRNNPKPLSEDIDDSATK